MLPGVNVSKPILYFPNLNGIRALAALSVVLYHTYGLKTNFKALFPPNFFRILWNGHDAVTIFFVLSGFLITYLLLVEHQHTGTIAVRQFYIRRILRIWPVYYVVVFIGFVVVPLAVQITGWQGYYPFPPNPLTALLLYIIWLPNTVGFFSATPIAILPLWTIGIEEQFYLLWPALLKRAIRWIPAIAVGLLVWRVGINALVERTIVDASIPQIIRNIIAILNQVRIENMGMGGLAAYVLFHNPRHILDVLFHPVVEKILTALIVAQILFFPGDNTVLVNMAMGIPYAWFILNLAGNPRSTLKLENRLFNRLGNYSYGIYMYHMPIIFLTIMALRLSNVTDALVFNVILYGVVLGGTLLVAAASYHWFEQPFLRLKARFTRVENSPLPPGMDAPEPVRP
jgi:peptidoglycan/LPS O-acetylase OafA/YrhL